MQSAPPPSPRAEGAVFSAPAATDGVSLQPLGVGIAQQRDETASVVVMERVVLVKYAKADMETTD